MGSACNSVTLLTTFLSAGLVKPSLSSYEITLIPSHSISVDGWDGTSATTPPVRDKCIHLPS